MKVLIIKQQKMKEVFEQLAFIKPMLNADDPKVQWAGLWSLICTCVSVVTGAFQFLSEEIMGVNVLFTILLFVIMIADYITGLRAATKEGIPKRSKKGLRWVIKLGVYITLISILSSLVAESKGIESASTALLLIKIYVMFHICFWEAESIDENLERLGYNFRILKVLKDLQKVFKSKIGMK